MCVQKQNAMYDMCQFDNIIQYVRITFNNTIHNARQLNKAMHIIRGTIHCIVQRRIAARILGVDVNARRRVTCSNAWVASRARDVNC